jgi:prepilin-type N-terminal cleavage/methylation domain-containing protein
MKKTGFTLIELLVVTVIVGILSSLGVPTYTDYADKAQQARSLGYQAQIEKLILLDCINNGYSCGANIVPNWAFSEGDVSWPSVPNFEIRDYRLRHTPGTGGPHYITIPVNEVIEPNTNYRIDVVSRDIQRNGATLYAGGVVGFSSVGSNIGDHARFADGESRSICDVFRTPSVPSIRMFVSARASASFDEVSIRKVEGGVSTSANGDCDISSEIVLGSDN